MKAKKRDIGLLYRIRDLYAAVRSLQVILRSIDDAGWLRSATDSDKLYFDTIMKTASRVIAIEEGKQRADFENFGFTLKALGTELQRRKTPWNKGKKKDA